VRDLAHTRDGPKELLAQVVLMIVIDIWLVEKVILSGDWRLSELTWPRA
jgi:hypothetical protein